ncbi:hypothetical protein ACOMHN_065793 [Nucella lapillus]
MRRKSMHVLLGFGLVNVLAILIFYGWVINSKFSRKMHSPLPDRIKPPTRHFEDLNKVVFAGHTLKPLRAKQTGNMVIPPVPEFSKSDHIAPLDDSIMKKYQAYPAKKPKDSILILTPVHDVEGKLKNFLRLLQSINYPHPLISIAFGEDSSHDNTLHTADAVAKHLRKSYAKVDVFHFNLTGQVNGSWSNVHSKGNQFHRRRHLAQARNALLRSSLKRQDWVLWIDSDIAYLPPDIIQQLLSAEKDIVVPACVYVERKRRRVFDKNTWRETDVSRAIQKSLSAGELMLEGYEDTRRLWLSDLRAEGRVVPVDGVGGCTLLVRSECHRNGLIFPETVVDHHIETEGLAKLAKRMGYGVYGMPFVEVIH